MSKKNITSAGTNPDDKPKRRMTPERLEQRTQQVNEVLILIESKAMSLSKASKQIGIDIHTFLDFIQLDNSLIHRYARAIEIRNDTKAEKIIKLAHNRSNDFYTDQDGNIKPNPVAVQRDRLIIDSEKWLLSKLAPKKYGDKVHLEADVKVSQPLTIDQVNEILKQIDPNVIDISHEETD